MILRVLTWFFGGLTVYAAMLMHEPFAEWTDPCPPSGFYEDHSECVPGLAGLFLIVPALIGLGFVILLHLNRYYRKKSDALSRVEKSS